VQRKGGARVGKGKKGGKGTEGVRGRKEGGRKGVGRGYSPYQS